MTSSQLCTFSVEDMIFGVRVVQVQEVLRCQPMTRVPLAHARVSGLINLRGQIVTAVDLRACLGLPPLQSADPPMNVVVRTNDTCVSLLVDAIGDVIDVELSCFEAPPSTISQRLHQVIDAVCKLPGQLLLVLAPERAIHGGQVLGDLRAAHLPSAVG